MARKKLFAGIDVGSHEIEMRIAQLDREELPLSIETIRRTVPIGTDTYVSGRISTRTLGILVEVLNGFSEVMRGYRVASFRAVATSAFREAANRRYALDQISRGCGFEIEVLSNEEERTFHLLAVSELTPNFQEMIRQGTLMLDIGSGSIQATVFNQGQYVFTQNLRLGSLRLREILSDLEQRTPDFSGLMEEHIAGMLSAYHLLEPKNISYRNLIVSGGELTYLRKLAGLPPEESTILDDRQLEQLVQILLETTADELSTEFSIPVEHASLLLPTAMVIRKYVGFTKASQIVLSATGLCDALLLDMARQNYGYKPVHDLDADLIAGCRHLARRYHSDPDHARQIERLALTVFDQSARLHRLPARSRLLLQAAAILHDCGKFIDLTDQTELTFRIIDATEFFGLSHSEKQRIAWAVRLQSSDALEALNRELQLSPQDQVEALKLASFLRLADALDIGKRQKISKMELTIAGGMVTLQLTASHDITLELWALQSRSRLFEELFGVSLDVRVRRS